jgi:hypothetical protein
MRKRQNKDKYAIDGQTDIVIRINIEVDISSRKYFEDIQRIFYSYILISMFFRIAIFSYRKHAAEIKESSFGGFVCLGKLICFVR